MDTEPNWTEIGRRIRKARERAVPKMSVRVAAERAPMSPTYWQDLERGHRLDGGRMNFSDEKLERAALVVGLDPAPLFALAGREYVPTPAPEPAFLPPTEALDRFVEAAQELRDALLAPSTPRAAQGQQPGSSGSAPRAKRGAGGSKRVRPRKGT